MFTLLLGYLLLLSCTSLSGAQTLKACQNLITNNGEIMFLTNAGETGPYFQCTYSSVTGVPPDPGYCYYFSSSYALTELPNTPPGSSSNMAACPTTLPNASDAGQFIWKVPSTGGGPGNCVTMEGATTGGDTVTNGTHISIETCNVHGQYEGQLWVFSGYSITHGNSVCVDVTGGVNADGTKLQAWTCFNGNTNQEFSNIGGDLLYYPDARFTWVGKNKCIDLTDGSVAAGNQLQVWTCNSANTNQKWTLEVLLPD
ncbi:ricin B lectin domain-containing protein [Flagelloscypha sp. PMI_526]|nr:ricin B lectin domain-containing protein [Flagelloscypha sp. PMI_526]